MNAKHIEKTRAEKIFYGLMMFHPFIAHANDELMIGWLHPGGGQYDCLSLMSKDRPVVMLNMNGSGTSIGSRDYRVDDIWNKFDHDTAPEMGEELFEKANVESGSESLNREPFTALLMHIADLIYENRNKNVDLRWGWFDSSEDSISNFSEFPNNFPDSWKDVKPVASSWYDWSANILQVVLDDQVVATYNQRTCEMLDERNLLHRFGVDD